MIEFGGVIYYIDMDALDKALVPKGYKPTDEIKNTYVKTYINEEGIITGKEETVESTIRGKEIDGPKYEIFRTMIELLLDFQDEDEEDASLGAERALSKKPLSYQLAFNTLYNYGILKDKE